MAKKFGATSFKTRIRMEKCARLESMGLSDADIAAHLGLSTSGVAVMKRRPDYMILVRQIATGVISQIDEAISEDIDFQSKRLRNMVPAALDALFKAVTQPNDLKLAVEAGKQILDRDGRLAQVSRVGIATKEQGGFAATATDVEAADAIAGAFKRVKDISEQGDVNIGPNTQNAPVITPGTGAVN